jgi:phosphatidate cytidylyltransferase
MLASPLASPLLPPLLVTVGALLLVAFAAIRVTPLPRDRSRVLLARWRTWSAIALVYGAAALAGPIATALLAAAVAAQGVREYAAIARLPRAETALLLLAAALLPAAALLGGPAALYPAALALGMAATLAPLLDDDAATGAARIGSALLGLLCLPLALSHLVLLATDPRGGPALVLVVALAVALSDVGAYLVGRAFGRRPLAPRLSPAKTREGVVGNVAGAALGVGVIAGHLAVPPLLVVAAVAVGALWGDLLESLIKRTAGVKDSGGWLPGFGGLLDRVDSLLVAAPLLYAGVALWP